MTSLTIRASDFQVYHYPRTCARRLQYRWQGIKGEESGVMDKLLQDMGMTHERAVVAELTNVVNLAEFPKEERIAKTIEYLTQPEVVLYQAYLKTELEVEGLTLMLEGVPDLLVHTAEGWWVQDVKLTNNPQKEAIEGQLNLYGFLLEQALGEPPAGVAVVRGDRQLEPLVYHGAQWVKEQLAELVQIYQSDPGRYEPVGWSKCQSCTYRQICWPQAWQAQDVAVIPDVNQSLAYLLHHDHQCHTWADLVAQFTPKSLSKIKATRGKNHHSVGANRAEKIMRQAQALLSQKHILLPTAAPLPAGQAWVMFDLEGIPSFLDGNNEIFLWGLKVYGSRPSPFMPIYRVPGDGRTDEELWQQFLEKVEWIFDIYGSVPFVHWANYEQTMLKTYMERYGDPAGVAERLQGHLFDLLAAYKKSVCLPLPSQSLKQVEKYVGFERRLAFNGEAAIVHYLQAEKKQDLEQAEEAMAQILAYNEEDLEATWAAYHWLQQELGQA